MKDNLDTICPPKITKASKAKPYTKVTFRPDYHRLGLSEASDQSSGLSAHKGRDNSTNCIRCSAKNA